MTWTGLLCSLVSVTSGIIGQKNENKTKEKDLCREQNLQKESENVPHDKSALLRNTHCVDKSAQDFFALVQHLDHFLVGSFPGVIYSHWG